ncbi:hypothetical protein FB451DRAFT_1169118 [Mycena latifolia]|nr:hypothetical protein FB451DRAFT_1169118 [Mycena latifolia]
MLTQLPPVFSSASVVLLLGPGVDYTKPNHIIKFLLVALEPAHPRPAGDSSVAVLACLCVIVLNPFPASSLDVLRRLLKLRVLVDRVRLCRWDVYAQRPRSHRRPAHREKHPTTRAHRRACLRARASADGGLRPGPPRRTRHVSPASGLLLGFGRALHENWLLSPNSQGGHKKQSLAKRLRAVRVLGWCTSKRREERYTALEDRCERRVPAEPTEYAPRRPSKNYWIRKLSAARWDDRMHAAVRARGAV